MTPSCIAKINLLGFLGEKSQLKKQTKKPQTKQTHSPPPKPHEANQTRTKGAGLMLMHEDLQEILSNFFNI